MPDFTKENISVLRLPGSCPSDYDRWTRFVFLAVDLDVRAMNRMSHLCYESHSFSCILNWFSYKIWCLRTDNMLQIM